MKSKIPYKISPVIYEVPSEEEKSFSRSASRVGQTNKTLKPLFSKIDKSNGSLSENYKLPKIPEISTTIQPLNDLGNMNTGISEGNLIGAIRETNCSENELDEPLITYREANQYFLTSDYYFQKAKELGERQEKSRGCLASCCSCLIGKLKPELIQEKNIISCMTKTNKKNKKNNEDEEGDEIEYRILITLFNFYTKEKKCPKEGEHWQKIGFQSDNPKNDLLTVGVFGLFQFLYFTEKYSDDAYELYSVLLQQKCDWVFAKTMFDITKIVINLMDIDALDYYFNKKNKVFYVLNELYSGMVYYFLQMVKEYCENNSLTLQFIASVIQEIRSRSYTEINDFMRNHMREEPGENER